MKVGDLVKPRPPSRFADIPGLVVGSTNAPDVLLVLWLDATGPAHRPDGSYANETRCYYAMSRGLLRTADWRKRGWQCRQTRSRGVG